MKWKRAAAGVLFVLFGVGTWNYTREEGREHHEERAAEIGFPPPADWMRPAGYGVAAVGLLLIFTARGKKKDA